MPPERDVFLPRWLDGLSRESSDRARMLPNGQEEAARKHLDEYRNRKYSRHYAFRRELDQVIGSSELLARGWKQWRQVRQEDRWPSG